MEPGAYFIQPAPPFICSLCLRRDSDAAAGSGWGTKICELLRRERP